MNPSRTSANAPAPPAATVSGHWAQAVPALRILLVLTVLTGVVYPLLVTGIAQLVFPWRANGSLLRVGDRIIGSELVGQPFSAPDVFWGRPSATSPAYDGGASSGSNLGPTNPALRDRVAAEVARIRAAHPAQAGRPVPIDLVTTSASGLDPHVTPAAALYQVERVAAARHLPVEQVRRLVLDHVEGRAFGVFGEPRVNVLRLNLALETLQGAPAAVAAE